MLNHPIVKFRRLSHGHDIPLPSYSTAGAAGIDLYAADHDPVDVSFGEKVTVPAGFDVEIPANFEGSVRGRSGLAFNHGVSIVHGVGTVDSDFRGEIMVFLTVHNQWAPEPFKIVRGMRIAQLVISPVMRAMIAETDELSDTQRGRMGLGSTGVS